ncbi:MAG: putative esterase YcpF (UPF0227 family) [Lentisphaeria bacterium]|jgi:predicted esterase YcpF (UPF0227 family)
MPPIIYIHGFLSSPLSFKAQATQKWLQENYSNVDFYCPQLSSYPAQAKAQLDELCDQLGHSSAALIGSSLGGFWATYLIEMGRVNRAVLINPAVLPHTRFNEYIGARLKNYYSDEITLLSEEDLALLQSLDCAAIKCPEKYWLMAQTGDETLDYRMAVEKYKDCKQLVESGGSHTFDGYQNWLPEIAKFLEL